MSTIAGTGLPTTGALLSAERVYRTPKGVRIHGEIPPPPPPPDVPTENLTEADKQKLREWGRKAGEYDAKYGDEIKARAKEAWAAQKVVFQIKQGGEALVTIYDSGVVVSSDSARAMLGLAPGALQDALPPSDKPRSREEEVAVRIAFFQERFGLANGNGDYEVFNAFAKPDDAKAGSLNDLRAGRSGYLLDLFS